MTAQLRVEPTLSGCHRYLISLLAYGVRKRIFRGKTQLAADRYSRLSLGICPSMSCSSMVDTAVGR